MLKMTQAVDQSQAQVLGLHVQASFMDSPQAIPLLGMYTHKFDFLIWNQSEKCLLHCWVWYDKLKAI
jgi:hypothetical protein